MKYMNITKTIIPIAYAVDDNYVIPVTVSIKSLLHNSKSKDYSFIILYKNSLKEQNRDIIQKSIIGTDSTITFIDVKDSIENIYISIPHITESVYYRFLLPNILSEYNQCLYLDGDTIIVDDVSPLLNLHLDDNEYISAVKCESLLNSVYTYRNKHMREIGINSLSSYVNCGVMLLNLKALRENDMPNKMIGMMRKRFSIQDQDIYNVTCYGHIKLQDPKYNVVPGILEKTIMELKNAYSKKQIVDARQNPVIIHFADKRKPWRYFGMKYGDEWDKYYNMIFNKNLGRREEYIKTTFIKRNTVILKNGIKFVYKKLFNKMN